MIALAGWLRFLLVLVGGFDACLAAWDRNGLAAANLLVAVACAIWLLHFDCKPWRTAADAALPIALNLAMAGHAVVGIWLMVNP